MAGPREEFDIGEFCFRLFGKSAPFSAVCRPMFPGALFVGNPTARKQKPFGGTLGSEAHPLPLEDPLEDSLEDSFEDS